MYRLILITALISGCSVNVTNTNPKIGIGEKATVKTDVRAGVTTGVAAEPAKPDPEVQLAAAPVAAVPSVPVTPDPNATMSPEQIEASVPKGPCYVTPYRPDYKEECEKYGHDQYGWLNPHETPSPEPTP